MEFFLTIDKYLFMQDIKQAPITEFVKFVPDDKSRRTA